MLTFRHLPVVLAILASLLTMPSLWAGLSRDDLIHWVLLHDSAATLATSLTELFAFIDPDTIIQMMEQGVVPWWTFDEARVSFFRPVAALTHWLDYQLWPDSVVLMHAQSIVWYAGVGALVALFYRRFFGPVWLAGLAALLFIVDDGHSTPVSWLANRNVLLAVSFGLLALLAHDRWRRGGWPVGAFLAPLWLALSLLSAEAGVATGAYLLAHAIFLDRGKWRQRLGCLVPYAAVGLFWQLAHRAMGYGVFGVGLYTDPVREPSRFLTAVVERGPRLLLDQWGDIDLMSGLPIRFMWLSLGFIILIGFVFFPLIRKDRLARFWAMGMILAVIPICAGIPSGRVLLFVGLGGMGLLAQFLGGIMVRADWLPSHRAWHIGAWTLAILFILLHGVLAPIQLAAFSRGFDDSRLEKHIDVGPIPEAEALDVVIVNAPDTFHLVYMLPWRRFNNQPAPAHTRVLAPGRSAVELTRLDSNTILVRPENGYQFGVFRSSAFPMTLGQRVELTGMSVEVTSLTGDGRPAEARIQFAYPLEDPSFRWLQWDWENDVYVPFPIPEVGETVRIPGRF